MKNSLLLFSLIFISLSTQAQQLVKDVNANIENININYGSRISKMKNVGTKTYFVAEDLSSGSEPWVTDGTAAGTHILKDINPGKLSSGTTEFVYSNGYVYFDADDGTHGTELWRTDGTTAGTQMVVDIDRLVRFPTGSFPHHLCDVNGVLYFVAYNNSGQDNALFKTDGTAAGTVLVNNLETLNFNILDGPRSLISFNGLLYFSETVFNKSNFYVVDNLGTTVRILEGVNVSKNIVIGTNMYFMGSNSASGAELWKTDGITTNMVKDIFPGANHSIPDLFTELNGSLFFTATDGINGVELWKSDGSEAGTILVKDITTANNNSVYSPTLLTNVNGTLYFKAYTVATNYEVWKSDGTEAGTVILKDILPGSSDGKRPSGIYNNNGMLLFTFDLNELWKSDGTEAGTTLVRTLDYLSEFATVTGLPGKLVFYASLPPTNNFELWITDGTLAGTNLVKNIATDNPSSLYGTGSSFYVAERFAYANGRLFFSANNRYFDNHSLYSTTGTEATTVKLDGSAFSKFFPSDAANAGGYIYYAYSNVPTNSELWKSDGTVAGTVMVKEIVPGTTGSGPHHMININGTIYFTASDGINGNELWKSDGTDAGTVLVKNIRPGLNPSNPAQFVLFKNRLFFTANNGTNGIELWKTDGTDAGTVMVMDIAPGSTSAFNNLSGGGISNSLTVVGDELFFSALSTSTVGRELWKTDGTAAGTVLVKDINAASSASSTPYNLTAVGNKLFFAANGSNFATNDELWTSDGTSSGTFLVKDINPGTEPSFPSNLIDFNGVLYFSAFEQATGYELWKSDGTTAGTVLVKDIEPGVQSGMQSGEKAGSFGVPKADIIKSNGFLYFPGATAANGRELWQSDGTASGTVMLGDLFPGPQSSDPEQITAANGDVYFVADDGTTGKELYVFNPITDYILPQGNGQNNIDVNWQNDALVEGTNQLIASIYQSGLQPVNDSVSIKLSVAANAFTYNGRTLAKKHVDIEPVQNAATATATVTLYFSQADFNEYNLADNLNGDLPTSASDLFGKTNLRIIQYHGVGSQPGNYPGTEEIIDPAEDSIVWNASGNYWKISFSVTGFSGFYLSTSSTILPVRLISFEGLNNANKHVDLEWKVAEQQGIVSYEIEKSTNGNAFNKIGFVSANNQSSFTYRFTDAMPFSETVFYRLKIIDQDGSYTYSPVIRLSNNSNQNNMLVYPNPVVNVLNISLSAEKDELVLFRMINAEGKVIATKQMMIKKGSNGFNWNVAQLAAGTYFISSANKNFGTMQIIKQ